MSRPLDIKWWLVTRGDFVHIPAIVAAETIEQIRDEIPLYDKGQEIIPALWSDLAQILNVSIPCTKQGNEQATGVLTCRVNGHIVSIVCT